MPGGGTDCYLSIRLILPQSRQGHRLACTWVDCDALEPRHPGDQRAAPISYAADGALGVARADAGAAVRFVPLVPGAPGAAVALHVAMMLTGGDGSIAGRRRGGGAAADATTPRASPAPTATGSAARAQPLLKSSD